MWFWVGPVRKQGEKAEGTAQLYVHSSLPPHPGLALMRANIVCGQVISQLIKS